MHLMQYLVSLTSLVPYDEISYESVLQLNRIDPKGPQNPDAFDVSWFG